MKNQNSGEINPDLYQLPNQDWVCGHHCEGTPCAIGPNGNGECIVEQICTPVLDGSGWHCARPRAWGGKCDEGPIPDPENPDKCAACPHQPVKCQPRRSLRSKRRLITGLSSALAFGFCLFMVGGSSPNDEAALVDTSAILSPGKLSSAHTGLEEGCAACHSTTSHSTADLLMCAFGATGSLDDSHKCLKCHTELGDYALLPHSASPVRLNQRTQTASKTSNQQTMGQQMARMLGSHEAAVNGELACSTCHAEHRGASFNLAEMSNAQCQSCHSSSFHSFSEGHPEFPEPERPYIHFDHVTHLRQYFGKPDDADSDNQFLTCHDCHVLDSSNRTMKLTSFDATCARCHIQQIADDQMPPPLRLQGTEFVRFDSSNGASLSPFMEVLVTNNEPQFSADINNDDRQTAPTTVAHDLIDDLLLRRHQAVVARLAGRSGADVVADRLTESGFFEALKTANDARSSEATIETSNLVATAGAWTYNDETSTLSYRSRGHADPLLRDWLSFAAAQLIQYPAPPSAGASGAFDRLFHSLGAPESAGHCLKCHTLDAFPDRPPRINWKTRLRTSPRSGFTEFSHGPHLTLLNHSSEAVAMHSPEDQCQTCHAVLHDDSMSRMKAFVTDDWMPSPNFHHTGSAGLSAVSRSDCAKCHTPDKAGDNCLQCHSYHIHADKLLER